jgi:uncharacterized protein with HEPN domain
MRRDDALLLDMLLACRKLLRFTSGLNADSFRVNDLVQSAVLREFQVLGDAARQVSDVTRGAYPEVPWHMIAGMRNRLVHAYFDIRLDTVWNTIQQDIPQLAAALEAIAPVAANAKACDE